MNDFLGLTILFFVVYICFGIFHVGVARLRIFDKVYFFLCAAFEAFPKRCLRFIGHYIPLKYLMIGLVIFVVTVLMWPVDACPEDQAIRINGQWMNCTDFNNFAAAGETFGVEL